MPSRLASCSLPGRSVSQGWNASSSKNACVGGYAPRPYAGTFLGNLSYIISTFGARRCTENSVFLKHPSSDNIGRVSFLNQFCLRLLGEDHASRAWHIQDRTARMDCVVGSSCSNYGRPRGRHYSCLCSFKLQRDDTTMNWQGLLFQE